MIEQWSWSLSDDWDGEFGSAPTCLEALSDAIESALDRADSEGCDVVTLYILREEDIQIERRIAASLTDRLIDELMDGSWNVAYDISDIGNDIQCAFQATLRRVLGPLHVAVGTVIEVDVWMSSSLDDNGDTEVTRIQIVETKQISTRDRHEAQSAIDHLCLEMRL